MRGRSSYSIKDFLIDDLYMTISYIFNTHNEPEKSLPQTDENMALVCELIDYFKKSFSYHPKFKELLFFNQDTEITISDLKDKSFSYDAAAEIFRKKVNE